MDEATHFCEPFYYRIKGREVSIWVEGRWQPSLHTPSSLRKEPDCRKVQQPHPKKDYLQYPDWRVSHDN